MIVDAHTHLFPAAVVDDRAAYVGVEPAFGALYAVPGARLATADDLVTSMDRAGVEVSVALGFAWSSSERCRQGNEALLDAAARHGARILPFATVWPPDPDATYREAERCARAGCRGLGELRPRAAGSGPAYAIDGGPAAEALAAAARDFDLTLLFHVSEPVGHTYPGKEGLPMAELVAFAERYPTVRIIAAHWGGGLPFYTLMPEVGSALANTWFDTAASSLLYAPEVIAAGAALVGGDRVLFGSDFPLLDQKRQRRLIESAPGLAPETAAAILGGNAARLFGLDERR